MIALHNMRLLGNLQEMYMHYRALSGGWLQIPRRDGWLQMMQKRKMAAQYWVFCSGVVDCSRRTLDLLAM